MGNIVTGVQLTELKMIDHPQGGILHAMKKSDSGFDGFGEAYFSSVHQGAVKAWKKHHRMTLNLVVPLGAIKFVVYDDRPDSPTCGVYQDVVLSLDNYQRLTVPPGVWVGFGGVGTGTNILLNIANLEHDPGEADRCDADAFPYDWKLG